MEEDKGSQRKDYKLHEILGAMDISTILIVVIVHRYILMPKFIKVYTLNMSSLLYVDYTSGQLPIELNSPITSLWDWVGGFKNVYMFYCQLFF